MARPSNDEIWAKNMWTKKKVLIKLKDLHFIANGVFSNVYKGEEISPAKRTVVVKKTWATNSEEPKEIAILAKLRQYNYPNIIQLLYVFANDHPENRVCYGLIFEFMPMTLYKHIKNFRLMKQKLNMIDVKLYTWQLFNAQLHLSQHRVCHRDIKPQNILIDPESGLLKLADFGSSKIVVPNGRSTSYQVTRYYRPPELLLKSEKYGTEIDVWSCGCVFGELLCGKTLMKGHSTHDQFTKIVRLLGRPSAEDYKAMNCDQTVYDANMMEVRENGFREILPEAPKDAISLLREILVYNPFDRTCGTDLLEHAFFEDIFSTGAVRTNGRRIHLFD